MNYAIIAAGEGSRLIKEGFTSVKPLVRVANQYLIERLINLFIANRATSISIIINSHSQELKQYLDSLQLPIPINLIVQSTPSSLHSFYQIIQHTHITECCLTTVDTIFNPKEFKNYIEFFNNNQNIDALMASTQYIDDEKPLYIQTKNDRIVAYKDNNDDNKADRISAGIYCLRNKSIDLVSKAIEKGLSKMRNYQRSLLENNLLVKDYLFSKVIDIDHLTDIPKAEILLKNFNTDILFVERYKDFSPNSENKDKQILDFVAKYIREKGFNVDIVLENDLSSLDKQYKYILSMARSEKSIALLADYQSKGAFVTNAPESIENCFRQKQTEIFTKNNIPIAKSAIIDTNSNNQLDKIEWLQNKSFWLKRADFQTIERIDVIKVDNFSQGQKVLDNYNSRLINKAIACLDIKGDVIKFYGVDIDNYFYYYYPTKDKFGTIINQGSNKNTFDEHKFITICQKAAKLVGLDIYGGDAIIDQNGNIYIIDMNDFPSFSICKDIASKKIAQLFLTKSKLIQ